MSGPMVDTRPRWRRRLNRLRKDPWGVVMDVIGDRTPGLGGPPLNWYSRKRRGEGSTLWLSGDDDGSAIRLSRYYDDGSAGDGGSPVYVVTRSERLFLLRFVVWGFVVDWCGLRSRLYYHALRKHLDTVAPDRHKR